MTIYLQSVNILYRVLLRSLNIKKEHFQWVNEILIIHEDFWRHLQKND